ncbi:MAG: ABC transporter substrate-binding protein [Holophaga sp.]|nr:ABC transporter substrate-binding protein [Holophaga sp.]
MKIAGLTARITCLALCTAFGAFAAKPAAIQLPAAVAAKKQVTVGVNGIFPPMEFKNPGSDTLTGFDVELAQAIGQTLGVKVVFDDQKFDQLLTSVTTNRVDFVLSGLSSTAVRQKTFDFIEYFTSGTQAYTTREQAKGINSLESLSGKTLAVSAATDYLTNIQKWSKENLEAKGKPGITMLPVDSEATARLQMVQGRAQASAISPEVFGWLGKQNPGKFVAFGPILAPRPYGICFKKDNVQLRNAVLAALKELVKNGTYNKILAKWDLSRSGMEPLVNGVKM